MIEQIKADGILEAIVHTSGVRAPVDGVDLFSGQQAVLDEKIRVDKIGVARTGAEALIGAVAVAGRPNGQDLPVALAGLVKKIGKIIGCFAERADAVGRGQGGNVH